MLTEHCSDASLDVSQYSSLLQRVSRLRRSGALRAWRRRRTVSNLFSLSLPFPCSTQLDVTDQRRFHFSITSLYNWCFFYFVVFVTDIRDKREESRCVDTHHFVKQLFNKIFGLGHLVVEGRWVKKTKEAPCVTTPMKKESRNKETQCHFHFSLFLPKRAVRHGLPLSFLEKSDLVEATESDSASKTEWSVCLRKERVRSGNKSLPTEVVFEKLLCEELWNFEIKNTSPCAVPHSEHGRWN